MSYSEAITYEDLKRILETIPLSTITYGRGEVGEIKPFAGSTIPIGWLLCDGSAVSRTTYSELFTVIGTTYGTGDGSTTFNLPDLRNRFMVGAGDEYELNDKGGDKNVTLDATMIPAHTHGNKSLSGTFDIRKWGSAGDDIVGRSGIVSYTSATLSANCKATGSQNPNAVQRVTIDASHEHTSVGGGQAHENRPPYIGINFIIYAKNTKTVASPQIDLFYPVGAYFETSDSTFDPNVKWGGTWTSENITLDSDTGWISLVPYIGTGFAARNEDSTSYYCPAYRIHNNVVYFKGFIYSTSAKNQKYGQLLTNLPNEIRVGERGGGSVRFQGSAYHIRVEAGIMNVWDTENIGSQSSSNGYHLACLSYVLSDDSSNIIGKKWHRTA